jgi:hypothetical protein
LMAEWDAWAEAQAYLRCKDRTGSR